METNDAFRHRKIFGEASLQLSTSRILFKKNERGFFRSSIHRRNFTHTFSAKGETKSNARKLKEKKKGEVRRERPSLLPMIPALSFKKQTAFPDSSQPITSL